MATTTSTTSNTTGSTSSITTALGVGSGIDIAALVTSLVGKSFEAKNKQLSDRSDTLTAQISGVAKLKSTITGFDSALKTLVKGGSLASQPTSSDSSVLGVSGLSGAQLGGLSASVRVDTLAAAQSASSAAIARTTKFPAGTLKITTGATTPATPPTATLTIAQDATIDDIAAQINAQSSLGLKASVVTDGSGNVRLMVKGATGAAGAFAIEAADSGTSSDGASLQSLGVGSGSGGMTAGSTAADAVVYLDGTRFTRPSNSISDLITGVKLDLKSTSATAVTLGSSAPSSAISQAVSDFVDTYNQVLATLKEENDPVNGVLKGDSAVATMARSLASLTTTQLSTPTVTGGPKMLADLGVSTNRDGTLSVDSTRLAKVLATNPTDVEAMFRDGFGATNGGLSAALSAIATKVTDRTYGLDAATTRYAKAQSDISDQQSKASDAADAMKTRMTQQFAAMDAKVAAYKSTQTFLENQIKAWNKSS